MGAESKKLLSMLETAKALGVSIHTVRRLVNCGEVLAVNVGARRLVRVTEIDRIIQHGVGTARPKKTSGHLR